MKNFTRFSILILPFLVVFSLSGKTVSAEKTINPDSLQLASEGETAFVEDEAKILEGEFRAGEMIMEHVVDNHEWHIATLGHTHVVIPLPVILICDGKFSYLPLFKISQSDPYLERVQTGPEWSSQGQDHPCRF